MLTYLVIAGRNLLKNRTRSLILGSAIATVTLLVVIFVSLASGIEHTILTNALALSSGHVNIAGFYKISQTSAAPLVLKFPKLRKLAEKEIPEASLIIDRVKAWGKIISETGSVMIPMWGIDMKTEKEVLGLLDVVEGSLSALEERGGIALFETQAKKLSVKVGDGITISMPTYRNMSNTKDLKVVAVMRDVGIMSNFAVFFHKEDSREIYQMPADSTGQIMIFLKNFGDLKKIEDRLRKLIVDNGYRLMPAEPLPFWMKFDRVAGESWTGQQIDITNWRDETAFMKWILDIFHALIFIMTGVLLFIVILGLVNALWMSIRERTNEIGTLRAIGLQQRQVTVMFLLEAVLLSVSATGAGIVLGLVVTSLINTLQIPITSDAVKMFLASNTLRLQARPGNLLAIFAIMTFCLSVGAIFPARAAGKMKPMTAIQKIT
ncbi:MAG: ABC transporter permease [Deltaproteobacteria bacterium]|nr:ABC transporter permease [Deltaproteobacteria bacterium]